MNKKLYLILLLAMLLVIPIVSATRIDYSPNNKNVNDMVAHIEDTILFGLIQVEEQGTMELKSHKSPTEVLKVGAGQQVTMYYDTNFGKAQQGTLGDMTFIDMRTGEEVQRDYKYVYWGIEEYESPIYECSNVTSINGTVSNECTQTGTETKTREKWLDFNSRDIPKGQIRIGVMVDVQIDDYIDGIWEVSGKKIDKHASWTDDLNTDIVSYYKLDETTGAVVDSLGVNNGTNNGATRGVTGKVGNAFEYNFGEDDYVSASEPLGTTNTDYTFSGWIKFTSTNQTNPALIASRNSTADTPVRSLEINTDNFGTNYRFSHSYRNTDSSYKTASHFIAESSVTNNWIHMVGVKNSTGILLYVNGDFKNYTETSDNPVNVDNFEIGRDSRNGGGRLEGVIDEVGIWSRALTSTEITQLYNGGTGRTYPFPSISSVTLNSPADDYISTTNEVQFNATATITNGAYLTNMSLWTNESGSWEVKNDSVYSTTLLNDTNEYTTSATGTDGYKVIKSFILENTLVTSFKNTVRRISAGGSSYKISVLYSYSDGTNWNQTYSYSDNTDSHSQTTNNAFSSKQVENISVLVFHDTVAVSTFGSKNNEIYGGRNYITQTFNRTLTDTTLWNFQACNSDGDCGFDISNYTVGIDTTAPAFSLISPNETFNYLGEGNTLYLTGFVNDTNIDTCWYSYNGTNNTFSCTTETLFNESFTQADSYLTSITVWANDSVGNVNSREVSWGYKVFENSRTHNTTSYQTAYEGFSVNVTANSSLTSGYLVYNGTEFLASQSGSIFTRNIDIPASYLGNNSVKWKFVYGGDNIFSKNTYQDISSTVWTICNATYTNDFLNLTFKDEADLTYINATIPTSSFIYYLGSGTETKTYTYSNSSENDNYLFCASPTDRTINVDPYLQYKNGVDYPQRIWDADATSYDSTVTEKILYLLNSLDGIYVTFQVIDSLERSIDGVNVIGNRTIDGESVIVADGTTGAGGGVTFWLNPDFEHDFVFSKTGYDTFSISLTPTQTTYTVTLSGEQDNQTDYTQGINYFINPSGSFLIENTNYDFQYTLSASNSNLDGYGFTLYADDVEVTSQSGTNPSGETLSYTYNISDASDIRMDYYYLVNDTYINNSNTWITYDENDFSLNYFFNDITSKIDSNIFGIEGNDNGVFSKALLSILIIILSAGILSSRYGLASEQAISGIIFGTVLFLNSISFLPSIENFPTAGHTFETGIFAVFITAAYLIFSIFKEELR